MLTEIKEGVILPVRVTPKASSNQIIGWDGKELKLKVSAAPEKGEANIAVIKLLSKHLNLPMRCIILLQGESSRHKRFCITNKERLEIETIFQINVNKS